MIATLSYFGKQGEYLDFEEIRPELMEPGENRTIHQGLHPPCESTQMVLDVSADEQTWIKRHWRLISTIAVLLWGIVILARRLG